MLAVTVPAGKYYHSAVLQPHPFSQLRLQQVPYSRMEDEHCPCADRGKEHTEAYCISISLSNDGNDTAESLLLQSLILTFSGQELRGVAQSLLCQHYATQGFLHIG